MMKAWLPVKPVESSLEDTAVTVTLLFQSRMIHALVVGVPMLLVSNG
jgi:hypothetical protein